MAARVLIALAFLLASCGIPKDPEGTLERVDGGVMRVGIAEHSPWTILGDEPSGIEVDLVEELALELDAEILWVPGAESEVLEQVELGHVDLAIAGLTSDNPWSTKVTFIQPYFSSGPIEHVMAVPHGENAWIVRLEGFLRSIHGTIPGLLEAHATR